eukprot:1671001-Prymnesium_polylepis.2
MWRGDMRDPNLMRALLRSHGHRNQPASQVSQPWYERASGPPPVHSPTVPKMRELWTVNCGNYHS